MSLSNVNRVGEDWKKGGGPPQAEDEIELWEEHLKRHLGGKMTILERYFQLIGKVERIWTRKLYKQTPTALSFAL